MFKKGGVVFGKVPQGIKVVAIINITVNLLLLFICCFVSKFVPPFILLVGLLILLSNIILGIGILLLKNWARIIFIIMQIISLVFSIFPFLIILTFGLGNPSQFGDTHEAWGDPLTAKFFIQLVSFIMGISVVALPMLFSIFCIFYYLRSNVKKQFKLTMPC